MILHGSRLDSRKIATLTPELILVCTEFRYAISFEPANAPVPVPHTLPPSPLWQVATHLGHPGIVLKSHCIP